MIAHPLQRRRPCLRSLALAGAAALALPSFNAAAVQCLFRGTDADARVVGNGAQFTPHPQAIVRQDCEQLRVVMGSVTVVTAAADGARLQRRTVAARAPLLEPTTPPERTTGAEGLMRELRLALQADETRRGGASRSNGSLDYPSAALPVGLLIEPTADLRLPLPGPSDEQLQSFALWVDGKPIVQQRGPAPELVLPAAVLKAGQRVQWRLRYADAETAGEVQVRPAREAGELLRDITAPQADDLTLAQAQALAQAGYRWDARARLTALVAPAP